eukprot:Skav204674  [mRNA]  locus=scaffold1284:10971:12707:+ [translate_table: standard]
MQKQVDKSFLHERSLEWTVKLKCVPGTNYVIHGNVANSVDDQLAVERVTLRVPREPLDFVRHAVITGNPRGHAIALPKELEQIVDWNRDADTYDLHTHRISFIKQWSARAKQLQHADADFLKETPEYLRKILKGKRLALWSDMLTFYEYPDTELIKQMAAGFPLFGWMPCSNVFPADSRSPTLDAETLKGMVPGLNARVKAKVLGDIDPSLENATWEETCNELERGWITLDPKPDENSSWAMRFGLAQKDKTRVIDDFTIAGVNQCVGLSERLKIFGVDDIAALLARSLDTAVDHCHPKFLGKTIDLKHAYKQFGIKDGDRQRVRVTTVDPTTRKLITLLVNMLPFGATGSVSAFLRISMSIWYLGAVGAKLAWTCFYDDFTFLSRHDACKVTEWTAQSLLELLGMVYAKEGRKATIFDSTFSALGVRFDLTGIQDKRVEIMHTVSRREELAEYIQELLESGQYSPKTLERLRGRLLWFENFVCGRQANSHITKLGEYIGSCKHLTVMDEKLKDLLNVILQRIVSGKPVVITPAINHTWLFFTDGACEETSSVGGALIHPNGKPVLFFGDLIPAESRW